MPFVVARDYLIDHQTASAAGSLPPIFLLAVIATALFSSRSVFLQKLVI
jgi:hypothetical protein